MNFFINLFYENLQKKFKKKTLDIIRPLSKYLDNGQCFQLFVISDWQKKYYFECNTMHQNVTV